MATKYKILIDGEEDDEGNAFDTESEADDYALQWESNWHAGGEVLEMSNPGDYPYDPDDCPSIEVVESETGWRRRPCARRRPPHGLSGHGLEDGRVRPWGGVAFP